MDPTFVLIIILVFLIAFIVLGIHIGLVLGVMSLIGIYLLFGDVGIALEIANQSAYSVLRNSIFAAIPLFVLMGEFMSKSGVATDLYRVANRLLRRLPGRLALATIFGNAVFAAVTGVSIASAMTFSRIAYPEMRRFNYSRTFALGSIAGSSCLGMLIPPSVLLIVWGVVIEESIGRLFLAGIIPGLVLALLMGIYVTSVAALKPELAPNPPNSDTEPMTGRQIVSSAGVVVLIFLVLGGLYAGFFTPTESAAVGCTGSIILALVKRLTLRDFRTAIIGAGKTIAPILFLLIMAAMYSKFLALGGVVGLIENFLGAFGLGVVGVTLLMVLIWLLMGTLIDSLSIILLTAPIFWPIAEAAGWNVYAFAVFGIIAIEAGLLTPPFGLLVYTVKGAVPDNSVQLSEIFLGAVPYWLLMLVVMLIIWVWPETMTFLAQ